jgi:hypothetical protein
LKEKMAEKEPIAPLLDKMRQTLSTGHRLWLVGGLPPLRPGEDPGQIPPLPQGPLVQEPYLMIWTRQMTAFLLEHHITKYELVVNPSPDVLPFENVPLFVVEGWH